MNGPPREASAVRGKAVDAYKKELFLDTYALYNNVVAATDTTDSLAIHLREQATAIGRAGDDSTLSPERAYREYVRLQRQAFKAAERIGNDSIMAEAAISEHNMLAYCRQNGLRCSEDRAEGADQSHASGYVLPLGFLGIVFMAIAAVLLLYPMADADG